MPWAANGHGARHCAATNRQHHAPLGSLSPFFLPRFMLAVNWCAACIFTCKGFPGISCCGPLRLNSTLTSCTRHCPETSLSKGQSSVSGRWPTVSRVHCNTCVQGRRRIELELGLLGCCQWRVLQRHPPMSNCLPDGLELNINVHGPAGIRVALSNAFSLHANSDFVQAAWRGHGCIIHFNKVKDCL